jgi:hypothetical protein
MWHESDAETGEAKTDLTAALAAPGSLALGILVISICLAEHTPLTTGAGEKKVGVGLGCSV